MSHVNTYDATGSPNRTHYSDHNVNIGVTNERSELLAWLSPIEPRIRHQDIRTRRAEEVGEWLLKTDAFQMWCDGGEQRGLEHSTLFCCGDSAVGKTYFSSLVVDRLCNRGKGKNIAVACFYVDFAAREEQSPSSMLGSLLKQIVGGLETIPEEISRTFRDYKKVAGGRGPRLSEIVKMLQAALSLRRTFLCIDALDECADGHRPEILDSLRQILEKSSNTRLFLTGRRYIIGEIERHLGGRVETLYMKLKTDDIVGYIRMRLSKDTSLDSMDGGLEAEIIQCITEGIPETLLQISLVMDAVLGESTAYHRRQRLKAMTDDLNLMDAYGATLERIKSQGMEKARLGMAALMWISHSERLLQLDELSHAIAIQIGSKDLATERIPSVETLLSCCLGLVVIDRETSTVRLVHLTLQEYLSTCPGLFGTTHSIMAETCLTYLNFQTIKEVSPTHFTPPHSKIFLKYSSLYWGVHARRHASRDVVSLALQLFGQIESHISTKLLLAEHISRIGRYPGDIPTNGLLIGFTGLHIASLFGSVEIASALMNQPNYDLNRRDFLGSTPLVWAAICGREQVAKLLLAQKAVIPDKPDNVLGRTPLSWAALKGHQGIVRLLLGRASSKPDGTDGWWGKTPRVIHWVRGRRYVNPNRPDRYYQTPILLAAEGGNEGVVRQLLRRKDVKPDTTDGYGRTPLFCASSNGCEGVMKLLLERKDVKTDRPDGDIQTLFLSAVESGYEGVVRLLLGKKDISPDRTGKARRTPLSLASEKGRAGVVEQLLRCGDVNPNMPDPDDQAPLSFAAMNGHDGVVKLLLGREEVDPNMLGRYHRTPLSSAAGNGHYGVVKLLLEREDVNPNIPEGWHGLTPLSIASVNADDAVVELLLGREDLNPNIQDYYGCTPLSWAAMRGYGGVAELLLGREDVSPDIPDKGGRTPLSFASENGHDEVVKLLLGRDDVDPDKPDDDGLTPLWWAAMRGHDTAVNLLLAREDVNPCNPDKKHRTPLHWAAAKGHERVVKLLLGRGDVNPDMSGNGRRRPLLRAAVKGHDRVVKLLLGRGDVNPDILDNDSRTPLHWAAAKGREGVVRLLLGRGDVSPDMPDNGGRSPLSLAAAKGHDGVVELLLGRGDVNPNMPDNDLRTPLSWAAEKGRVGVVRLLLGRKGIDPGMQDDCGLTPLSWAARCGHEEVVEQLLGWSDFDPGASGEY